MKIVWTRRAVLNLHHVRDHIGQDNPNAARMVGSRIDSAVANLSLYSKSGRMGEVPGTRELVLSGLPYIIVYRIYDDAVHILRILHTKQKWPHPF